MIALLKILLAAAPTSMANMDPINIMTDVLPEEMLMTVMQSMKLGRTYLGFSAFRILQVSLVFTLPGLFLNTSLQSGMKMEDSVISVLNFLASLHPQAAVTQVPIQRRQIRMVHGYEKFLPAVA